MRHGGERHQVCPKRREVRSEGIVAEDRENIHSQLRRAHIQRQPRVNHQVRVTDASAGLNAPAIVRTHDWALRTNAFAFVASAESINLQSNMLSGDFLSAHV